MGSVFIIALAVSYLLAVYFLNRSDPEIHWDWGKINLDDMNFPAGFTWGTATAAHQVEGNCYNNNWWAWENSPAPVGSPRIKNGEVSGSACEHWSRYREDIGLMKDLNIDAYRFSVEWSKVEPLEGSFDQSVLDHYHDEIEAVISAGIKPVITLYHFTHPAWFADKGGFEKTENIEYFQRFCEKVFTEFSNSVETWCTINEIEVEASQSYFIGDWPPGKQEPQLVGEVMKNLLEAHTRVYHGLKKLPNGIQANIGLVKNIFQFDPWNRFNIIDIIVSRVLNWIFNGSILKFLESGEFKINIPGLVNIRHNNPDGAGSNDFIGLNYYSHMPVKFNWDRNEFFKFRKRPDETATDMDYTIYPEGLYRALRQVSELNVPVIVTENGIADAADDRRELWIRRYIYAVSEAIKDGVDIRGYFYWSLMDNFEWSEGYSQRFGLYAVDFTTQERKLRKGSVAYRDIVSRYSG